MTRFVKRDSNSSDVGTSELVSPNRNLHKAAEMVSTRIVGSTVSNSGLSLDAHASTGACVEVIRRHTVKKARLVIVGESCWLKYRRASCNESVAKRLRDVTSPIAHVHDRQANGCARRELHCHAPNATMPPWCVSLCATRRSLLRLRLLFSWNRIFAYHKTQLSYRVCHSTPVKEKC